MSPSFDPVKSEKKHDRFVYCPFTKYHNVPWVEVVEDDVGYVEWLISPDCYLDLDEAMAEFLEDLLERYYGGELEP